MRLLIVGFTQPGHMGDYLASAARQLGLDHRVLDAADAQAKSRLGRSIEWRLCGKRPAQLKRFAGRVLDTCAVTRYDFVLTTGSAPLDRSHIEKLRDLGAKLINYSTDDPWNPAVRAPWFFSALPSYDAIFTPRRANVDDFRACGVREVHYLPFAFDPEVHRPWPENTATGAPSDVLFVGGCDADRLPLISALIDAGLDLALFGGYWDGHSKTRRHWRGLANQDTIRSVSAAARICLCLVRRSNRDGHVMRSFEAAAIGGCILAEDTADHRELFGPDDHAVRYFKTTAEMVEQSKLLLADADARRRLSIRLRERLLAGKHTYADRLTTMLQSSNADELSSRSRELAL
jgi:spore maturation protein CgeB